MDFPDLAKLYSKIVLVTIGLTAWALVFYAVGYSSAEKCQCKPCDCVSCPCEVQNDK